MNGFYVQYKNEPTTIDLTNYDGMVKSGNTYALIVYPNDEPDDQDGYELPLYECGLDKKPKFSIFVDNTATPLENRATHLSVGEWKGTYQTLWNGYNFSGNLEFNTKRNNDGLDIRITCEDNTLGEFSKLDIASEYSSSFSVLEKINYEGKDYECTFFLDRITSEQIDGRLSIGLNMIKPNTGLYIVRYKNPVIPFSLKKMNHNLQPALMLLSN